MAIGHASKLLTICGKADTQDKRWSRVKAPGSLLYIPGIASLPPQSPEPELEENRIRDEAVNELGCLSPRIRGDVGT